VKTEFAGDILSVRVIEDCIRVTRKYTKGAFRRSVIHPIQGEDFPSRVLTEYYEVYPDMELGWDMPASDAWTWILGDTPHIDVYFHYNYTTNKAKMIVHGDNGVVQDLVKGIPGLDSALTNITSNGQGNSDRR